LSEGTSAKGTYPRTKGRRTKPALTEDDIERFLSATLRVPAQPPKVPHPGYWLIFRLIIEHDLRTGDIVGAKKGNRPGIQYGDLKENSIWVHTQRLGAKRFSVRGKRFAKKDYHAVRVSHDLLREIRKFADEHSLSGKLFNISEDYVRKLTRKFAKEAKIPQYELVNPEILRDGFKKSFPTFPIDLGGFDAKLLRRAERMAPYYQATFCIEKGLRELVSERMAQTYTEKWWEEKIDSKMQLEVKTNQHQERSTLMFVRSEDPMEYTTILQLLSILEQYWEVFKNDFTMGLPRLRDTVNTLNQLRIVIAHNSELTDEQKKKFEVMMDDWRAMQPA
jgi:hypothetical protein